MTPIEPDDLLHERIMALIREDPVDGTSLVNRLDQLSDETGQDAHSAIVHLMTQLSFGEDEARRHLISIVASHADLSTSLQRTVGLRVAALDHFLNRDRRLVQPTLIEFDALETGGDEGMIDTLSGLITAQRFRAQVHAELTRALRYGRPLSALLMDLDDFEEVNERLGPQGADQVLHDVARLLGNVCRDIDLCSRPGEDEFALLLPETDRQGAWLVAERFRRELRRLFGERTHDDRGLDVTISIGVACAPEDARTAARLLERAAEALYEAKATGKNQVRCYRSERRRCHRFALSPDKIRVELIGPSRHPAGLPCNISRTGILFASPVSLEIGEAVEIRLIPPTAVGNASGPSVKGHVVRVRSPVEPEPSTATDRSYEVGVAFETGSGGLRRSGPAEFLRHAHALTLEPGP